MQGFAGKVAVVTGAAQGIGIEIATDLAAQGAWVALADINVDGGHAAAANLNETAKRQALEYTYLSQQLMD